MGPFSISLSCYSYDQKVLSILLCYQFFMSLWTNTLKGFTSIVLWLNRIFLRPSYCVVDKNCVLYLLCVYTCSYVFLYR
ncbi:hypothetical protein AQUCO_00200457v1 [Aquilegia coerulea]|uniref:Uncharacterized protein n=1 Tax=Aquilegia coerulea TaxID=218851 RepID=A0A2G5F3A9_AQUCA|nr:hypothetical protein AQUCO_00200457v1 [Aquilegia coerulea]